MNTVNYSIFCAFVIRLSKETSEMEFENSILCDDSYNFYFNKKLATAGPCI